MATPLHQPNSDEVTLLEQEHRPEPQAAPAPDGWSAIWSAKWWIAAFAIIAAGAAYGASTQVDGIYRSTATIRVAVPSSSLALDSAVTASADLAAQYSQLVDSTPIRAAIARRIGGPADDLRGDLSSGTVADQNLIRLEAQGASPREAQIRADAGADSLVAVVDSINRRQLENYELEVERRLRPLDQEIERLRREADGPANDGARNTLDSLITERARQRADASTIAQPSVRLYEPAAAGAQVEPKPVLYTVAARVIALLVAAQLAVLIRRRRT